MRKFIKIKSTISPLFKFVKKKKVLVIFILVLLASALLSGSVLAYSIKTKNDADKAYQNQNYKEALNKYKLSQQYWFPERISYRLRDRDLYAKIDKTNIMIESGENYTKGVGAYANKQYAEAKQFLSSLVLKDPNYQKAQELLATIEKEILPKQLSSTIKAQLVIGKQVSNSTNTLNNNSTETDWKKFAADLNEKLKDVGTNNNQTSQPTPTQFQLTEDDFTYDFNPKTLTKSSLPQKIDFTLTFLKDFDYGQITSITFYLVDTANNINRTPTFMRYMFDKNQNKIINDSMTALFNNNEKYVMNKIFIVYKDNSTSTTNLIKNLQYLEIQ